MPRVQSNLRLRNLSIEELGKTSVLEALVMKMGSGQQIMALPSTFRASVRKDEDVFDGARMEWRFPAAMNRTGGLKPPLRSMAASRQPLHPSQFPQPFQRLQYLRDLLHAGLAARRRNHVRLFISKAWW